MASQEAVPARFNLAESYMQMREYAQAKRVLEVSCIKGIHQRQKASALLSQLPSSNETSCDGTCILKTLSRMANSTRRHLGSSQSTRRLKTI